MPFIARHLTRTPLTRDKMSMTINTDPYWWEEAPPKSTPHKDIDPECDVVVIGAGYTGLTAALTLSKAGKSVQVFDKDVAGAAASSRNGGITSGSLRISYSKAAEKHGEAYARAMFREVNEARQHLKDLIVENDIECDYHLTGLFTGALTQSDFNSMQRETELFDIQTGGDTLIVTKDMLPDYIGSDKYAGGISNDAIGTIHPAKFVAGLYEAACKAGANVHAETAVLKVERRGGIFHIETERGTCQAENVVVATNGYTDGFDRWLRRRLVPVKSRIVVTEKLSPNLVSSLMPRGSAMGERKKLYHYFRPTPDGKRILMGGREPPWVSNIDKTTENGRRALTSIFPQLDGVGITHSWSGNVAFSRANVPQFFSHDGIHYAVGYCGSGTVWAPWLGKKAALKILGDPNGKSCFECDPPKSVPLYNGTPWFLPVVIAGYGIQDWISSKR